MPWSSEWVVLIESRPKKKAAEPLGTGTLVAAGRVLTARHVVFDEDGKQEPALLVRREGSDEAVPATVVWSGSDGLDVAILEAKIAGVGASHPLALLSARDLRGGSEWEAQGHPTVRERSPSRQREQVRGKTCAYQKGNRSLCLDVDVAPDAFDGLSGASVVVEGQIVGVMQAVAAGWDGKRLEATPVAAFLDHPEFRDALGLKPEHARLAEDLAALEGKLAALLQRAGALTDALAEKLSLPGRSGELSARLAHALIHTSGKEVATILSDLDATLDGERDLLRDILFHALPLAMEWRAFLVQAHAAFSGEAKVVELPLRTETLAEIILAGANGRPARFSSAGSLPQGIARIPIPSAAHAPFFQGDGDRLVEAVVMNFCQEGVAGDKHWAELKGRFPKIAELKVVVRKALEKRARKGSPDQLSHYLLVIDADLGAGIGKDVGELWAVARRAFGKDLPSLCLVRLTGGEQELADEYDVADSIKSLRDRPLRRTP